MLEKVVVVFCGTLVCASCSPRVADGTGKEPPSSGTTDSVPDSAAGPDMPLAVPKAMDAAAATQPSSPSVPDAASTVGTPDAASTPDARAADAAPAVPDGGRDGGPGLVPDAGGMHFDPSAFLAIQSGQGDAVSTAKGKWSFDTANGNCRLPYTAGKNTLLNDKQAGSRILCFVQLVLNKVTGQAYVQDGLHLWWRWNGVDQWTPEVTGDPRNPTAVPPLGPNRLPTAAVIPTQIWGWLPTSCCKPKIQQVSPVPGGFSQKMVVTVTDFQLVDTYRVERGKVFLVSMWSNGSSAMLQMDHDATSYKEAFVLPTAGWVQTLCKHIPNIGDDPTPTTVGMWWKLYVGNNSTLTMAEPYIGTVAPDYPAPWCYQTEFGGRVDPNPLERLKK